MILVATVGILQFEGSYDKLVFFLIPEGDAEEKPVVEDEAEMALRLNFLLNSFSNLEGVTHDCDEHIKIMNHNHESSEAENKV